MSQQNHEKSRFQLLRDRMGARAEAARTMGRRAMLHSPHHRLVASGLARRDPLMLNVGCGPVKFDGWVNIDLEPGADLMWDLRKGLPFPDDSVKLVYNEHFIEHIPYEDGTKFLAEVHRCLKPGGVVRLATPDLDHLIETYSSPDWRDQEWLRVKEYAFIQTPAMMLNVAMRWWGHQHVYNEEDLRRQLEAVGFGTIRRMEIGKSDVEELRDRETRPDSKLILEGVK